MGMIPGHVSSREALGGQREPLTPVSSGGPVSICTLGTPWEITKWELGALPLVADLCCRVRVTLLTLVCKTWRLGKGRGDATHHRPGSAGSCPLLRRPLASGVLSSARNAWS